MSLRRLIIASHLLGLTAFASLELAAPPQRLEPPPDTIRIPSTLKLRNTGQESLVIREIRSCCGCLSASAPAAAIGPGAEFELPFFYDAKGRKGLQKGSLILVPSRGEPLAVPVEVLLRRAFDAEPRLLRWAQGSASLPALESLVTVDPSLSPAAPRILNPSANFPAELLPGTVPGQWILRVSPAARPSRDSLSLELPLKDAPPKRIEVYLTRE
ncbi:MAG: hypothetical protein RL095_3391 [Verrucomicrobiota bacterium]|jgi:hypothetical protein